MKRKLNIEGVEFEMDIKLSALKSFMGREGVGMNANLHFEGKKIAFVRDSANGGCMDYDILGSCTNGKGEFEKSAQYKENENLFAKLQLELSKLPKYTYIMGGEEFKNDIDLDILMAHLADEIENEKHRKKQEKKGICYTKNGKSMIVTWKQGNIPKLLKFGNGLYTIQGVVDKKLAEGCTIDNQTYLESVGVKFK